MRYAVTTARKVTDAAGTACGVLWASHLFLRSVFSFYKLIFSVSVQAYLRFCPAAPNDLPREKNTWDKIIRSVWIFYSQNINGLSGVLFPDSPLWVGKSAEVRHPFLGARVWRERDSWRAELTALSTGSSASPGEVWQPDTISCPCWGDTTEVRWIGSIDAADHVHWSTSTTEHAS